MGKKLAASVYVDGKLYLAGAEPPKKVADQITNPKAWTEADTATTSDESGDKPYSKRKVDELKAEVDKRNADRDPDGDDYIVPEEPGNKPELVAALEADDEKQAGSNE